jgi:hypothetical protein
MTTAPAARRRQKVGSLVQTLFRCVTAAGTPGRVKYVLRDERWRPLAERTWADHGVCLTCGGMSLVVGRCVQCVALPSGRCTRTWWKDNGPIVHNAAKSIGLKLYSWRGCKPRFHLDPRPKG